MKDKFIKAATVMVAASGVLMNAGLANAASLTNASVGLSDPRPSQVASYTFTGSTVTTATAVRCIKVTFSSSTSTTVTPTGFTAASATVNASSSLINASTVGWTATPSANTFTYTHATGVTPSVGSARTFVLDTVTNSSVADTNYYYKISTYTNVDCATGPIDNASVQYINTNGSTLSLSVDNTLSFTVNPVASSTACNGSTTTQASTATTIPFGTVTPAANGVVCQDLSAATNSTNGYTIFARYTAKPTNGLNQTIADWTGSNTTPTTFPAPGTEAYGMTTNDATLGTGTNNRFTNAGQKWAALAATNAEVAYEAAGVTSTTYRIAHQVGISLTTSPGTYQTTVIYTCTPVY